MSALPRDGLRCSRRPRRAIPLLEIMMKRIAFRRVTLGLFVAFSSFLPFTANATTTLLSPSNITMRWSYDANSLKSHYVMATLWENQVQTVPMIGSNSAKPEPDYPWKNVGGKIIWEEGAVAFIDWWCNRTWCSYLLYVNGDNYVIDYDSSWVDIGLTRENDGVIDGEHHLWWYKDGVPPYDALPGVKGQSAAVKASLRDFFIDDNAFYYQVDRSYLQAYAFETDNNHWKAISNQLLARSWGDVVVLWYHEHLDFHLVYTPVNGAAQVKLAVQLSGTGSGKVTGTGIDCGSDCTELFQPASATEVSLTATAAAGSFFAGWSGACTGMAPTCTVTMESARDVNARFDAVSNSGATMVLRDAIYLYHQPISGSSIKRLIGYNCDVLQMLLDVESGYTDIATLESTVASSNTYPNTATVYPDHIHANAPIFSYALYTSVPVKTFELGRFIDNGTSATGNIGTVTMFGYCFSTKADAKVLMHDGETGTCHLSDGATKSCAVAPDTFPQ
jgi:hypothetical protein